ncbi:MAG: hypothetical protein KBS41_02645 [Oscillospiraceae bacterium]|nr:hypothetical protein [Candidatus Equicaccousia limihippi]
MKKTAACFLCFIILSAVFCSCDKPEAINGDTVYIASEEDTFVEEPKNWEHIHDGSGVKMLALDNQTELAFDQIEAKPSGFNGWEEVPFDLTSGGQFSYTFAAGDVDKYQKWDFRFRVDFNVYYTVGGIDAKAGTVVLDGNLSTQTYKYLSETAVK